MPRHRVINRHNTQPLSRRSLSVSDIAVRDATELAARLGVSQGSIVDTALRELTARPPDEILDALARHGHLTPDERVLVEDHLTREQRDPQ